MGAKVSSEAIPHIWTVPRKLHRTDILSVVAPRREDQCDALGLSLWKRPVALRFSMTVALAALWLDLTVLLQWVDYPQAKNWMLTPVSVSEGRCKDQGPMSSLSVCSQGLPHWVG